MNLLNGDEPVHLVNWRELSRAFKRLQFGLNFITGEGSLSRALDIERVYDLCLIDFKAVQLPFDFDPAIHRERFSESFLGGKERERRVEFST